MLAVDLLLLREDGIEHLRHCATQPPAVPVQPHSLPTKGKVEGCFATSVMLLDCAKLAHWDGEKQFDAMFSFDLDYKDWVCLLREDPDTIGAFESFWNDFDNLTPDTRLLHNTKRQTQPWKTGLPIDFRKSDRLRLFPPRGWIRWARRHILGDYAFAGQYKARAIFLRVTTRVFGKRRSDRSAAPGRDEAKSHSPRRP